MDWRFWIMFLLNSTSLNSLTLLCQQCLRTHNLVIFRLIFNLNPIFRISLKFPIQWYFLKNRRSSVSFTIGAQATRDFSRSLCEKPRGVTSRGPTSEKELLYAPEFSGVHSGKNHCERRKKWSVRICRKTNAVCAGIFSGVHSGKNRCGRRKKWSAAYRGFFPPQSRKKPAEGCERLDFLTVYSTTLFGWARTHMSSYRRVAQHHAGEHVMARGRGAYNTTLWGWARTYSGRVF